MTLKSYTLECESHLNSFFQQYLLSVHSAFASVVGTGGAAVGVKDI